MVILVNLCLFIWSIRLIWLIWLIWCLDHLVNPVNLFAPPAVGGDAGLVRSSLPGQREERRHHGQPVGHGDPAGDRDQQPPAPPQAAARHPGDGVPDQPLCSSQHTIRKYALTRRACAPVTQPFQLGLENRNKQHTKNSSDCKPVLFFLFTVYQ